MANKQYKIAAFTDDILLFFTEPHITLPNLNDFRLFQFIVRFEINFTKSHALNIALPEPQVKKCKQNFPFTWQTDSITYLGIQLPANLVNLYSINYHPLLKTTTKDLQKNHISHGLVGWQS